MPTLETVQVDKEQLLLEKHQKLQSLAKYSIEELRASKKSVLYELFKEHISTELAKEVFGKSKSSLKKSELLELIEVVLAPIWEERKVASTIEKYDPEELEVTPTFVITNFKNGVTSKSCAEKTTKILRAHLKPVNDESVSSGFYTVGTLSVKISNLLKALKSEMPEGKTSERWLAEYSKLINTEFYYERQQVRKERAETVERYGNEVLVWIDAIVVENFVKRESKAYLDPSNPPEKNWALASFILALTSGRRMVEIHGNTTYEKVDNRLIKTIGLAKKKSVDFEHISPIAILDVDTWLAIFNKLPDERKNLSKKVVNQRISGAMTDNVAYVSALKELNFKNLTKRDKEWGNYHNARDFYISYLVKKNPPNPVHQPLLEDNYAISLVAHEGKATGLNYKKMAITNVIPNY